MRSEPLAVDGAVAGRGAMGVAPAQQRHPDLLLLSDWDAGTAESQAEESVRCELAWLTALLRRNFAEDGDAALVEALADTSDPAAADSARQFLEQIRRLAEALAADARRWASSAPTAAAIIAFQREALKLLSGIDDRLHP